MSLRLLLGGLLGLALSFPTRPASGQAFGRLEDVVTNATVYTFARPSDATKRVFVWGAVQRPGLYEVVSDTDVNTLLSLSGGPAIPVRSDEVAQRVRLRVYHQEGALRPLAYDAPLDSLFQRPLPPLQDGDVVQVNVSQRRIRTWRDELGLIGVATSAVALVATVVNLLR